MFLTIFLLSLLLFVFFVLALSSYLHKLLPKYLFVFISFFFDFFFFQFLFCLPFSSAVLSFVPPLSPPLWSVFFGPTETVWVDFFFFSLHRYSTAASCSSKFISLHIRHRASYTHVLNLPMVETSPPHSARRWATISELMTWVQHEHFSVQKGRSWQVEGLRFIDLTSFPWLLPLPNNITGNILNCKLIRWQKVQKAISKKSLWR